MENEIERIAVRAQKELILLHRMSSSKPKGTARWLKERNWCTFHHHVRCPERVFRNVDLESWVCHRLFSHIQMKFYDILERLYRFT